MSPAPNAQPVLVKRYARDRPYDTVAQRYVSVEQLRRWVAVGFAFCVIYTKTGTDVTHVRLA